MSNPDLYEILDNIKELLSLEFQDLKVMNDLYLRVFKDEVGMDWEPRPIFYNNTSIILTDIEDYEQVMERSKCEDLLKIESKHFNLGIYVVNTVPDKRLCNMLGS